MTQVVRFYEHGGPDLLRVENIDLPPPGPDEVTIRIQAFGLNRAELLFLQGYHPMQAQRPSRMGMEAAGIVVAVGNNVSEFKPGDHVSLMNTMKTNQYGAWAEAMNVPTSTVVHSPIELNAIETAGLWCAYITAYGALIDLATIEAGDYVLINAASSSAGIAAIQVVNMIGAVSIAVTRTAAKAEELAKLGAQHVIVSQREDLTERIATITHHHGIDVAYDPVAGPFIETIADNIAPYGQLIIYGVLSPDDTPLPLASLIQKNISIHGYAMYLEDKPARNQQAVAFIREGIRKGALRPIIARTFSIDAIAEACHYLNSFDHIGKVVINNEQ